MNNELQNILQSTINDFNDSGLYSDAFLTKAHQIYNSFAYYSCPLPSSEHPYLLGVVFSHFALYYKDDIDKYTSIIENALFCFLRVIYDTEFKAERQSAAIRLLLLIDGHDWVMKGILRKFYDKHCDILFNIPQSHGSVFRSLMSMDNPWIIEEDMLKCIGSICIELTASKSTYSEISAIEMKSFDELKEKYNSRWGHLIEVPLNKFFKMFYEHITEIINTPYERRITHLFYNSL